MPSVSWPQYSSNWRRTRWRSASGRSVKCRRQQHRRSASLGLRESRLIPKTGCVGQRLPLHDFAALLRAGDLDKSRFLLDASTRAAALARLQRLPFLGLLAYVELLAVCWPDPCCGQSTAHSRLRYSFKNLSRLGNGFNESRLTNFLKAGMANSPVNPANPRDALCAETALCQAAFRLRGQAGRAIDKVRRHVLASARVGILNPPASTNGALTEKKRVAGLVFEVGGAITAKPEDGRFGASSLRFWLRRCFLVCVCA